MYENLDNIPPEVQEELEELRRQVELQSRIADSEAKLKNLQDQKAQAGQPRQPTETELQGEIERLDRQMQGINFRQPGAVQRSEDLDRQLAARMNELNTLRNAPAAAAKEAKRAEVQAQIDTLSAEFDTLAKFPTGHRDRIAELSLQLDALWEQLRTLK